MSEQKEFLDWWDGDKLSGDNPYSKGSPLYWAWEGFLAGLRIESEACAKEASDLAEIGYDGFAVAIALRATARARARGEVK